MSDQSFFDHEKETSVATGVSSQSSTAAFALPQETEHAPSIRFSLILENCVEVPICLSRAGANRDASHEWSIGRHGSPNMVESTMDARTGTSKIVGPLADERCEGLLGQPKVLDSAKFFPAFVHSGGVRGAQVWLPTELPAIGADVDDQRISLRCANNHSRTIARLILKSACFYVATAETAYCLVPGCCDRLADGVKIVVDEVMYGGMPDSNFLAALARMRPHVPVMMLREFSGREPLKRPSELLPLVKRPAIDASGDGVASTSARSVQKLPACRWQYDEPTRCHYLLAKATFFKPKGRDMLKVVSELPDDCKVFKALADNGETYFVFIKFADLAALLANGHLVDGLVASALRGPQQAEDTELDLPELWRRQQ
jgi:hypothetical protein